MTRTSRGPLRYSRFDGVGFVRWWRGHGGEGEWLIGGAKDAVISGFYVSHGHENAVLESLNWTNASGSLVSNFSITFSNSSIKALLGQEILDEEDITCEDRSGGILQMERGDKRICDGHTWDCKYGRDERSCLFHKNLTSIVLVTVEKSQSERSQSLAGIYHLQRHIGFYKHSERQNFIYRKNTSWSIGSIKPGSSEESSIPMTNEGQINLEEIFTSEESIGIPEEDWKELNKWGEKIETDITVSSLPESINETMLTDKNMKAQEVDEGILCKAKTEENKDQEPQWLFINFNGPTRRKKCDNTWHCDRGLDEAECNNLAEKTLTPSIIVTGTVLFLGLVAQLVRAYWSSIEKALPECLRVKRNKRKKPRKPQAEDLENQSSTETKARDLTDKIIRSVQENISEVEAEKGASDIHKNKDQSNMQNEEGNHQYKLLHDIEGGVGLLVGSGFCLLSAPEERHRLAKLVFDEEERIHKTEDENEILLCLRSKCHSNAESALCLDHRAPPGIIKKVVYNIVRWPTDWILEQDNWFANKFIGGIIGVLPVAVMSLYIWDFTKDTAMFVYLYLTRWTFIRGEFSTIHNLIAAYGISIILSTVVMCWNTQMTKENGIVSLDKIKNGRVRRIVRVFLFAFTLGIPLR